MTDHAAFHVSVIIPTRGTDLHAMNQQRVAHAALHHSPGEKALAAKAGRRRIVQTVQVADMPRLVADVHQLRRLGLHPERQLVCADARLQFAVVRVLGQVAVVEPLQRVQLATLADAIHAPGGAKIQDGRTAWPQQSPLVRRRQIAVAPHGRAVDRRPARVLDNHVARHVAVAAAQAVAHPRANRRAAGKLAPGGDMQRGWPVILVVRLDAVNKRKVIHVPGQVRETVRQPAAALPVLGELKRTANRHMRERQAALQFAGNIRDAGERLAVEFAQPWFVLERVHLAHPTLHEKENAALGLTRKMGAAGGEGAVRRTGPEVIDRHATKRHGTDAIPSTRKKLPSI